MRQQVSSTSTGHKALAGAAILPPGPINKAWPQVRERRARLLGFWSSKSREAGMLMAVAWHSILLGDICHDGEDVTMIQAK